ncbi:RidA family protein [Isachenkonia alkalipeptolytica]|uniref:RidA family protein n=1 Tax=Isachenkonia alkalipeptolytica TaxID=2565777 RepID=A0AA43XKG8_9CLOT|nr:RidA family protein [Isachenkonia alkalipeptolytica]NBG88021.1 RidA family protein [Isachenkonia alkalipeptolytica]
MNIKRYEGTGRMSRAVVHHDTVYLCGQTCGEANTDVKEQTKVVLEKIEKLLNQYGSDKNHILSTTIYLKNIEDFSEMNEVWDNWVEAGFEPARACVEARMAREDLLVEMTVVAALKA